MIIGIDCATQDRRIGLARAERRGDYWELLEAFNCDRDRPAAETLEQWLFSSDRVLIAMDSPLGWPAALGPTLTGHEAGDPLRVGPEAMFRRCTDKFVARTFRKTPLDVGADRIARTAHSALTLLDFMRLFTKDPIPLAWTWPSQGRYRVIEVYPAATLRAYGVSLAGYRKREGAALRRRLAEFIGRHLTGHALENPEKVGIDGLDAALCIVAGIDFMSGNALPPDDLDMAKKEGWIWVRRPE